MNITVLNVAYPLAPVGPDAVGGAEQILTQLDLALTRAGCESLVLACEGSVAAGRLLTVPRPDGELTDAVRKAVRQRHRDVIEETLRRRRVDLVHMHGIDCFHYLPETDTPVLITLHLPPSWYPPEVFRLNRPSVQLHCVSHHQQRACPAEAVLLPPIENGVALDVLRPRYRERGFAIALGRICQEKGFHLALDAARRADVSLVLAGEVFRYQAHEQYFQREIAPRLDHRRRFIGPVGLDRKRRLLAAARCLLLPSLAPETSSLVAMEALACGTPVIAFPSGALPEIVEHGRTGFLVRDEREMADAIAEIGAIDPRKCREAAEARFSAERMCKRYLDLYHELAHPLRPSPFALRSSGRAPARAGPLVGGGRHDGARRPRLAVEESTTFAALESLRSEWSELWRSCSWATPFQSPAWLIPWARHFDPDQLWTLAVRCEGRLAAVAPFFIHREASSARKLLLVGSGNTDYLDVLTAPEHRREAAEVILQRVLNARDEWDVCEFQQLREDSPLLDRSLSDWRTPDAMRRSTLEDVCPVLDLPEAADDLCDCLPRQQWKKLQYYRRRAGRTGKVEIETATQENFDELFDALLRLHRARWAMRGLPGVLADDVVRKFHREAAAELLDQGMLRLTAFRLDGRIIAALYGLCHRRRTYYYLGGFDPQHKQLSPGVLIVGNAIETALREHCREFDFLRGSETYKYAWGARDRVAYTLRLQHEPILQKT